MAKKKVSEQPEQAVSAREFAALLGLPNHQTVLNAIIGGEISEKNAFKIGTRWKIYPEAARKEWADNHKITKTTPPALMAALGLDVGATAAEKSTSQRLREAKEALEVKKRQLELDEKLGLYLLKKDVERAQFQFAKELRQALLAIPSRISADLVITNDQHEAHTIVYDAIEEALAMLSDMNSRTLQKNEEDGEEQ